MKKKKPVFFLVLFLLIISTAVFAQTNKLSSDKNKGDPDRLLRIENPVKEATNAYNVILCGESGVLVFFESIEVTEEKLTKWYFIFYDNQLKVKWSLEIPLIKTISYKDFYLRQKQLYLYFQKKGGRKSDENNFQLIEIQVESGENNIISGIVPEKARFIKFLIHENLAYIGLNERKNKASISIIDLISLEIKTISIGNNNSCFLENINIDTFNNTLDVITHTFTSKRNLDLIINEYTLNGDLINSLAINNDQKNTLYASQLIPVGKNKKFLIGTYTNKVPGKNELENSNISVAGFYFVEILNNKQQEIKFYNILDFKNLNTSLKGKEIHKLRKKAKNKKDGKDISIDYRLLVHDVIYLDEKFIIPSEAFYPEYRTVSRMYYDYYGRPMPQTYTVFEGYKYYNANVFCVDEKGNLLWDNSISVWSIVSFQIEEQICFLDENDEIVIVFSSEGKIASTIIKGNETTGDLEFTDIETSHPGDKLIDEELSSLKYWYDNFFICYGFQTIKNNSLLKNEKRKVFYINKIAFQ
jgi:hypothetical protein